MCLHGKRSCSELHAGCTARHPDLPGLHASARHAGSDLRGHTRVFRICRGLCMASAEPSLPCKEEKGSCREVPPLAPRRRCQGCRRPVPSEKAPTRVWPLCPALSPTLACRPWGGGCYLPGDQLGTAAATSGHGEMCVSGCGRPLPPAALPRQGRPQNGHPVFGGIPRAARGPSPPGAGPSAAVPSARWNGIPGAPGWARGIGILPALSLASAGELVTWLCA